MKVALIGTGMMGERMAGRLLDAGHDLTVYNRTRARTDALAARGAVVAASPRAAAAGAAVVITVLADPDAVRALSGGDDGLLAGMDAGALWIDMSTVSPEVSRELAAAAAGHGVRMLDAPVSGSLGAADKGLLVILAGGAAEDVAAAGPVFEALGRATLHLGPAGSGSAAKLALNSFLCAAMVAAAEALRLGVAEGVPEGRLLEALSRSDLLPSWTVRKLEDLHAGASRTAFATSLAAKDLRLAADTAAVAGLELPVAAAVRALYESAEAAGLGGRDFAVAADYVAADER